MDYQESLDYLKSIMERFYHIGMDNSGGVTRLAYTEDEDLMHYQFSRIGIEEGYIIEVDEVGNSFLSLEKHDEYYLIGSHLDSVINGGRYDGVLGVAVGVLLLKKIKEEKLNIPLKVVALRCEESTNFSKSTFGSSMITGDVNPKDFETLKSKDGKKLGHIFDERGYNKSPDVIKGVKTYLELHIEQGKVLESKNLKIGVITAIAGNTRFKVTINGRADHSGATPMLLRKDALCGAAEIILGIEDMAKQDPNGTVVATVGVVNSYPNALNVVPGETAISIDIRDGDNDVIENMKKLIEELVEKVCNSRELDYKIDFLSSTLAVKLDEDLYQDLSKIANRLGIDHLVMTSGAGHDAMKFASITKSGMIFVPCKDGISHNPKEDASLEDAVIGSEIILEYLKEG